MKTGTGESTTGWPGRAEAADRHAHDRLRLVLAAKVKPWAPGQVAATAYLAAVDALLGLPPVPRDEGGGRFWRVVGESLPGPPRWLPPAHLRPPFEHPIPMFEPSFDAGPNRDALVEFFERSRLLTIAEVGILAECWSASVWTDPLPPDAPIPDWWGSTEAPYGRAADVGQRERKGAYNWARGLGSMKLPHYARLAIKGAAGAIAVRDLIDERSYRMLCMPWRAMLDRAPRVVQILAADTFVDWPSAPWRVDGVPFGTRG